MRTAPSESSASPELDLAKTKVSLNVSAPFLAYDGSVHVLQLAIFWAIFFVQFDDHDDDLDFSDNLNVDNLNIGDKIFFEHIKSHITELGDKEYNITNEELVNKNITRHVKLLHSASETNTGVHFVVASDFRGVSIIPFHT